MEQTEVEEPQDPAELAGGGDLELEGDHHHGHHQGEGQDSTQLVQQVGEGRNDSHTIQLRRTRSVPKYFILKVIQ